MSGRADLSRELIDDAVRAASEILRKGKGPPVSTVVLRQRIKRFLEDLPSDLCVHEILDIWENDE